MGKNKYLLAFSSPFLKGGLRGFWVLSLMYKLKSKEPTPSIPLLKKGEA